MSFILENKEWIFSGIGVSILTALIWFFWPKSGTGKKQIQKAGDASVNVQAGEIHFGITVSDAKQIAQEVFDNTFYKLQGVAMQTATHRANEILDRYLEALAEQNPEGLESATDPDMQYALFRAQMEYARCGVQQLADVLVDILVDRASTKDRSLLQIVLNESIGVAAKLTDYQFDILSVIFILRYTRHTRIDSLESLKSYLREVIVPFIQNLRKDESTFQHLEYTGCGQVQPGFIQIEDGFRRDYPGCFWKGLTKDEADQMINDGKFTSELLTECFHNTDLYQFKALNEQALRSWGEQKGYDADKVNALLNIQHKHLLDNTGIRLFFRKEMPELELLFETWASSPMQAFTLTSVGIAIAHANIRRKTRHEFDLNIWIK